MYTKKIIYKQWVQLIGQWVEQSIRTTDDATWHHLQKLNLRKDVKDIVVVDNV